jgi:hypothetical protein
MSLSQTMNKIKPSTSGRSLKFIMPKKRSRCKESNHFYCPHCQTRIWRSGSPKHFLFYQNASEIKNGLNVSTKKSKILSTNYPVYVDQATWIEEFFCPNDGHLWLLVCRKDDRTLSLHLPAQTDWNRTTKTILPDRPNPSVSEYTYRMSRNKPRIPH